MRNSYDDVRAFGPRLFPIGPGSEIVFLGGNKLRILAGIGPCAIAAPVREPDQVIGHSRRSAKVDNFAQKLALEASLVSDFHRATSLPSGRLTTTGHPVSGR